MITFGDTRFVAVSIDNEGAVFSPVKGRGGSHVLTLPVAERPGVDALAYADGNGRMLAVCGGDFKASNLVPGATRAMCDTCDTWLKSDAHAGEVSRTLAVWESATAPKIVNESCPGKGRTPVAGTRTKIDGKAFGTCPECNELAPVNAVMNGKVRSHTRPAVPDTSTTDDATPTGEDSAPVKIVHKGREIDPVARETDGKCAYEVTEDDGTLTLKIVHGRSKIAPVAGSETVNVAGEDMGTCPVCRTHVKLTGSGFVPTHRPGNVQPDGPVLSQKSVPAVDRGTPVADMAKVREREAYVTTDTDGNELTPVQVKAAEKDGETVKVVPVVPTAPEAGAAVGNRDHGRLDGVAMTAGDLPPVQPTGKGYAAKAGTMALPVGRPRPDAQVIKDVYVGGRGGYLTQEEYDGLSRTGQRAYWRNVKTAKDRADRARKINRVKSEATGERISPERRKAARKSTRVGSSASGTVARPVTRVGGK